MLATEPTKLRINTIAVLLHLIYGSPTPEIGYPVSYEELADRLGSVRQTGDPTGRKPVAKLLNRVEALGLISRPGRVNRRNEPQRDGAGSVYAVRVMKGQAQRAPDWPHARRLLEAVAETTARGLGPNAFGFLGRLAYEADSDGVVTANGTMLEEIAGCDPATAHKAVAALEARGLIASIQRTKPPAGKRGIWQRIILAAPEHSDQEDDEVAPAEHPGLPSEIASALPPSSPRTKKIRDILARGADKAATIENFREAETITVVVGPLLAALGYEECGEHFRQEVHDGGGQADYLLLAGDVQIPVEVKKWRENLKRHDRQAYRYAYENALPWAILTNGRQVRVFRGVPGFSNALVLELDLFDGPDVNEEAIRALEMFARDVVLDRGVELAAA